MQPAETLIPYPLPFGPRVKLMRMGVDVMIARYEHGEDSKEHKQAFQNLEKHERSLRRVLGVSHG